MQIQNQQKATPLLSRREAAEFLGVRESTLAVWHTTNRYPLPVIKVGRLARLCVYFRLISLIFRESLEWR